LDPAYDFLLACARYCLAPQQFGAPVFPAGVAPQDLLNLAFRHRALAVLYKAGKSVPGLLPELFLSLLRGYYASDLMMSEKVVRQVKNLLVNLRSAGVKVLVFKAWAAFPTVYEGEYGARAYTDIDLLIAPEQLKKVDARLLALGYQPVLEFWPGYRFRHHITGITYSKTIAKKETHIVDLHWGIFTRPYHDDRIRVADVFARATPLAVAGEPVLQFSIEDAILHTCGHLSLHHQYEADLSRYYELAWWVHHAGQAVDWQAVLARSTTWKLTVALQRFALESEKLFPHTFPAQFLQALRAVVPEPAEVKTHDWLVRYFHTPLSAVVPARWTVTSLWDALGLLLEATFPSPHYLEQRYGATRFLPMNYWRRWADLTRRLPGSAPD